MLRLEHVWVEANVAMLPSRGGLGADSTTAAGIERQWVPLDASYKRHTRTAGIDLAKAVPFNADALITDLKSTATVDDTTGSVQNLDQSKIDSAITAYQAQVKAYLEQNAPNATVGDVLGTSQIRPYQSKLLSPVLPYAVNTVISDYQALPDSMKHYFLLKLYADSNARLEDNPYVNVRIPTTKLNGKPLAMSFKPASKADEDLIASYLPKPHTDGTPIQPSELPTSLPGYLIHMTPELTLDGQTLATGQSYRLGDKLLMDMGMDSPNSDLPKLVDKTITVGEYHAIGYNLQGMSQQQLQATKAQLEAAKSKLQSQDQTQLASLTKHDITGAILQAGVQSYFAINQTQSEIASRQAGLVDMPYMSFGSFATHFTVVDRYGMPWQVSPKSMMMDIDRYFTLSIDHNNDAAKTIQFRAASGARMSANEHLVPEALFDDPNTPAKEAEGISAVKALKIAMQQGQKIYTITQSNQATVLPLLQHSAAVMQDIQNALAAGKVVTVSASKITYNGWTGSGYILLDQQTGAGAYLIGGGMDGAIMTSISNSINNDSYNLTM